MSLENSTPRHSDTPIRISEKESKELYINNHSNIINVLNECYLAFGLLDIIDNSNTSKAMKIKIENVLKNLGSLEQVI